MASIAERTQAAASRIENAVADGRELVSAAADQASRLKEDYLRPAWTRTRDYARANPGKCILVSAAAGVLVGALVFRRR